MCFVQKANVILEVSDEAAERYYNDGYNIINEDGSVIKEALPSDIGALRIKCTELQTKVTELENELALLKQKKPKAPKK